MMAARAMPLLETLGSRYPIMLAPMFGSSGPDLMAAVVGAGGFAFFPGGNLPKASLKAGLQRARDKLPPASPPLGVNIWASSMVQEQSSWSQGQAEAVEEVARCQARVFEELGTAPPHAVAQTLAETEQVIEGQVDALLEEGVNVVSVHFGWLKPCQVERLLNAGVYLIGNATNVAEARSLEDRGCCAIIAQGASAGGHRGTFLDLANFRENAMFGTEQLVREITNTVPVPVIAAGGIMNGTDVRAMLDAGAQGVMMGTAFLATNESSVHTEHRRALLGSHAGPTVVTQALTGKPARALVNSWTREMDVLQRQLPNCFNGNPAGRTLAGAAAKANRPDLMIMWAGDGFARCRALPAADLVTEIVKEAEEEQHLKTVGVMRKPCPLQSSL